MKVYGYPSKIRHYLTYSKQFTYNRSCDTIYKLLGGFYGHNQKYCKNLL